MPSLCLPLGGTTQPWGQPVPMPSTHALSRPGVFVVLSERSEMCHPDTPPTAPTTLLPSLSGAEWDSCEWVRVGSGERAEEVGRTREK